MALSGEQKNFIKKYIWQYSPRDVAAHLGVSEREIHSYLQKRWRPEKYKKYLSRLQAKENPHLDSFSLKKFLFENRYVVLFLIGLIFAVYVNSLGNAFVSDDLPSILNNPDIGNFGKTVLSSPFGFLQRILYWAVFKISGHSPVGFRLVSIIFHLGVTFLAYLILFLTGPRSLAIMAASLFAVHPILTESVTWISGSIYVQSAFFFLLSLVFYILSKQKPYLYFFSVGAYLLSILSSEKAVAMCAVFALYEYFFDDLRANWKKLWPFFGITAIAGLVLLGKVGYRENVLQTQYYLDPGRDSLLVKIPTSLYSYLRSIFWPDYLSIYRTEMVFSKVQYFGTIIVFLLYLGAILWAWFKKNKTVAFWLIFFPMPLLPTLTPMRIAWAVAERYVYLGTLGILVAVAWIFYRLSRYERLKYPAYSLFAIIIIVLSVRTMVRNTDWKNETVLWTETEKTSPSGPNIHNNMGAVYQERGEMEKAVEEFQLATKINPEYADAYHNLANTYSQMGQMDKALENYKKAAELNPNLWQTHQNLAAIYYEKRIFNLAIEEIKKALEINPGDPSLLKNAEVIKNGFEQQGAQKEEGESPAP